MRVLIVMMAAACLSAAAPALAHPAPFSYLDLRLQPAALDVTLVVHAFDAAHELGVEPVERVLEPAVLAASGPRLARLLGDRLQVRADGRALRLEWSAPEPLRDRMSLRLTARSPLDAAAGAVAVDTRLFPYDAQHQTFVNVYDGGSLMSQAILDTSRSHVEYAGFAQSRLAVVWRFLQSGVHHILIGPDHLLFLVGLLLLGGSLRRLLLIVSAFTLAHSLTLSLAVLGLVTPPARIVEPAIALSIVVVGVDNLMARGGRDLRAWMAFAFGFVHGFGFAGVLREIGLPPGALGWSLFSFNLGVEIGQVLVVVLVASALAWLRARNETAGRRLAFAGSLVVIAAGAFWFVERLFVNGGVS